MHQMGERELRSEKVRRSRDQMTMVRVPPCGCDNHDHLLGEFRTENLVAILRAVPHTDGTSKAVASEACEYGSTVLASTVDEWIQEGREDLIAGDTEIAFARFATAFDEGCSTTATATA